MNIASVRDRQNWAIYLASAALLMSLISCSRSTISNAAAPENNDSWRNERHYPPLVFNSSAWVDCSISSSANGRQAMTTTSGQGFTFDATMLPIEKSKLQLIGQSGMKYKFDSFPVAAVKARFTGLGDGMITEMKTEVEVAVARFTQSGGAGTAIQFTAADIATDSAYVEFTGLFVRTSDTKRFPFRVLFGRVQDGSGTVIPFSAAPETTLLSKHVTLGSLRLPVAVTTALYEAEDDVARLKMP
ncbi:MAG: hypothetical protein DMG49_09770 [Acidobacteria bacterium]|nr:MAG: hypothetical protein DMG49_09770 [Acidobacteriota bacterium]